MKLEELTAGQAITGLDPSSVATLIAVIAVAAGTVQAVYESMLPRQPLRFILADDPGAGKTIMAGLYIRELIIRADAERILIVTAMPIAIGGALVIPAGLLRRLHGSTEVEESRGCKVVDVSAQKCGWDITSYPPAVESCQPKVKHIEAKGKG